jgi:predicted amidohydrolase YtcJ
MAARLTTFVVVAIVAATLIAGLIVGAQRDDSAGPVDLIVHNARVYTADGDGTMAEAVAIRGNQILRVGSEREVLRLQRPQTVMIDAGGGAVLPGFNDAHLHLLEGGLALDKVALLGTTTLAEIQQRITDWAGANPDEPWVTGRGWRYETFPGGLPTKALLDTLVSDRPVCLWSYDARTAWVNSAALKLAHITSRTPHPANGVVVKDPKTGEPTGVLKEDAINLVARLIPPPTQEERARALRSAVAEAHRNGITSVQNAGGSLADLNLFAEARRSGDLNLRIYSAVTLGRSFGENERTALLQAARQYPDDPLLKTGAAKLVVDGGVTTHTAAMLEPYGGTDIAAEPSIAPDDLNRIVRLIDAEGWQVMAHAAGDLAVRMTLDAYAHAARSNRAPERGRRHRVEHAETIAPDDVDRFGRLGVIASMQPALANPESAAFESWSRSVGAERASRGWAFGQIIAAGGRLAFGSDWPAAELDPLLSLESAITPVAIDGADAPSRRIPLEAAIDAYTSGAAWASFDEQRKGTLAPGMLADLVVLSSDIFEETASLARARIEITIFDGRIVYRRDRGSN